MRPVIRIAVVVVGFALGVYGVASLTGGWLGAPPWWERPRERTLDELVHEIRVSDELEKRFGPARLANGSPNPLLQPFESTLNPRYVEPRPGREWISVGLGAVGIAFAAYGAWPGRRRPPVTSVVLVVVGLVIALYGVANLTGRWLGVPPWAEPWNRWKYPENSDAYESMFGPVDSRPTRRDAFSAESHTDEPFSGVLALLGVGIAAFGAWRCRRPAAGSTWVPR